MTFYNRLDPVMIGRLLPEELGNVQKGYYANAFRILDAGSNLSYLFAVLLLPVFSRMIKQQESVVRMVKISFTIIITVSLIVSTGCIFYSREIMTLLYPGHGLESTIIFKLLIGGFVAVSSSYIFGTLMTANGNLKELNIISFLGLLINLMMNFLLIPKFLAEGSAWASLTTQFFISVIQIILVQRIFRLKADWKYIVTLLIFISGVIIFNIFSRIAPEGLWIVRNGNSWILNLFAMVILSFVFAAGLKLWNIRSLIRIIREDR
jgi:O-antigen/teichoic acid export membrane protein